MNKLSSTEAHAVKKPDIQAGSALDEFRKTIENKYKVTFRDIWELQKWTVNNIPEFWAEMWKFSGIIYSKPYEKVLDLNAPIYDSSHWFSGAKLNFAENLLRYRDNKIALILTGEDKETEIITYAKLYEEVSLYAAAFRKFGLRKGDVVACYISNRKEPIYAMEAVVSIGAIWSAELPLLGAQGVIERLKPLSPRVLLTVDRIPNQGKYVDMLQKVEMISKGVESLEKIIIVTSNKDLKLENIGKIRNSCFLHEFLEIGRNEDGSILPMQFEQVPFSHPVFVNYTSGTTDRPKSIVHGCGILLGIFKDRKVQNNAVRDDVWFSASPAGWLSWNIATIMQFLGLTTVVFEGIPYFLSSTYFWDMIDQFKVSILLIPTSIMEELQKKGYYPTRRNELKSLKVLSVGGSSVKPDLYGFGDKVKKDIIFHVQYGSTEITGNGSSFQSTLHLPIGEISSCGLGVDLMTLDETGNPVIGEMGDIVITNPLPYFPLGLWGDHNGAVYKEKYFAKFPGKFELGDCGIMNPVTKGIVVCGRSDATLKHKGWRFGCSEIYNVVEKFSEVYDSICVSQCNKARHDRVVLFLKMKEGQRLNEDLSIVIRETIRQELSMYHVPEIIVEVKDIPYNMNGKKMEIIVKKLISHMP